MLPDLRFLIGAVLATALLGVTLFGLAAAMHISHQSKLSPLDASRMLAYTPDSQHRIFDIPARRGDSPFANIPADPNPVPLQQPAAPEVPPVQTAAAAQPAPMEQPMPAAEPVPVAEPVAEPAPAPQPANLPPSADDPDTVDERAIVDPPLSPDNEPPVVKSAPDVPSPEPAAAAATPIETAPAAPAPVAEQPPVTPEVQQVGSIPPTTAETPGEAVEGETEAQEPPKAKRKRVVRRAKAKRPPPRMPTLVDAFGYPINTTSTANRPARGFWGPFN